MLDCILKQVHIRNVKVNLCHWHADHGWISAGPIHHPQPYVQSLPQLACQSQWLSTLCSCSLLYKPLSSRAPLPWSLLSFRDYEFTGFCHSCWFHPICLARCLQPHKDSKLLNEWVKGWMVFLQGLPREWQTEVPGEALLGPWTHTYAGLDVRETHNCIAELESKEN